MTGQKKTQPGGAPNSSEHAEREPHPALARTSETSLARLARQRTKCFRPMHKRVVETSPAPGCPASTWTSRRLSCQLRCGSPHSFSMRTMPFESQALKSRSVAISYQSSPDSMSLTAPSLPRASNSGSEPSGRRASSLNEQKSCRSGCACKRISSGSPRWGGRVSLGSAIRGPGGLAGGGRYRAGRRSACVDIWLPNVLSPSCPCSVKGAGISSALDSGGGIKAPAVCNVAGPGSRVGSCSPIGCGSTGSVCALVGTTGSGRGCVDPNSAVSRTGTDSATSIFGSSRG
jgi:hypothetical protein